ncbi:MAG: hypothetical protein ACRC18_06720 [Cetobacterium sp.]
MSKLTSSITCKGFILGEVGDECVILENIDGELVKVEILKNKEVVIIDINSIK